VQRCAFSYRLPEVLKGGDGVKQFDEPEKNVIRGKWNNA